MHSDSYSYLQHPALLRSWDHHLDTTITITPPPWSVTTSSSSSLVTVTVDTTKVTAAAAPKVVCLGRQVSGVSGDKFVNYGFRWDDAMVIQSWHFIAFSFMWLNVFRDYIKCRTWQLLNRVTGLLCLAFEWWTSSDLQKIFLTWIRHWTMNKTARPTLCRAKCILYIL